VWPRLVSRAFAMAESFLKFSFGLFSAYLA